MLLTYIRYPCGTILCKVAPASWSLGRKNVCFAGVEGSLQDLYQAQEILQWLLFCGCNMIESMIGMNFIKLNQGCLQFFFCVSSLLKSQRIMSFIPFILRHIASFWLDTKGRGLGNHAPWLIVPIDLEAVYSVISYQ